MSYAWLTYLTARQQLAARLSDENNLFWTDPENGLYIQEALRVFNSLTATWKADFPLTPQYLWNSLATLAGSPRTRTVTDVSVYTLMQYQLLEPPTGGTWTGTHQFAISDFASALQARRDEMIQVSNCNQTYLEIPSAVNMRRTALPDTVIDVARVRFLGTTPPAGQTPPPVTLYRDDSLAREFFEPEFYQNTPVTPGCYMLSAVPPLAFDVDTPPSIPGLYELIANQSGTPFSPPNPTLLGVPDDFAWVARLGALADLLGRESDATDRARAEWCQKRYLDGLRLLSQTPWIMLAKINGQAADLSSMAAMDRYQPEWDTDSTAFQAIVIGGTDFFAAPIGAGVLLTVLGNAPLPVADTDYVQVSRSNWDAVLDYAHFLACFKMGGAEFAEAQALEARFLEACAAENTRLRSMGFFSDVLLQRAGAQERNQDRYRTKGTVA